MIDGYTQARFAYLALEEMARRRSPIDPCRPNRMNRFRARLASGLIWTGQHIEPVRPVSDSLCPDGV
jgi:hypothetical protein